MITKTTTTGVRHGTDEKLVITELVVKQYRLDLDMSEFALILMFFLAVITATFLIAQIFI